MFANEVLEKTFLALKEDREEICFLNPAYVAISSNGFEKSYAIYKNCFSLDENWIVSFGSACKRNPLEKYGCSIAIIPIDLNKRSEEIVLGNKYFFYSPIFAYKSGELAIRQNSFFFSKMIEVITRLGAFQNKNGSYDERVVEHLRDNIIKILS